MLVYFLNIDILDYSVSMLALQFLLRNPKDPCPQKVEAEHKSKTVDILLFLPAKYRFEIDSVNGEYIIKPLPLLVDYV
jgi:hypothetical protein